MKDVVTIFGESEKGPLGTLLSIDSLPKLAESLGVPTDGSEGLHLAVQTLMSNKTVLFYRVTEEGSNIAEYARGLKLLQELEMPTLVALALPGIGDPEIQHLAKALCKAKHSILIVNQRDFYDIMTS